MLNFILLFTQLLNFSIQGTVTDVNTSEPIEGTTVVLVDQNKTTITDANGNFEFKDLVPGKYTIQTEALGYEPLTQEVVVDAADVRVSFTIMPITKLSEEIVVTAIRANSQTPVTQYNLSQKEIKAKYYGHDIPALISKAPGVINYSENGTGIGYSYFRLRGIDQTRINLTVNGIPINDPETQGYYFNNFADLASGLNSIQIQRGVGTSTNGAASFGGAVNMITSDLEEKPSFSFSSGYGSFVSRRLTGEYQSGLISKKLAFSGRLSTVGTDGYRDNSSANVNSYAVSGAYFGKKSLLKINSFGGQAQSSLSYIATDKSILDTNRTFNPLGADNRDKFRQTFYQLQYTYQFSKKVNFASSAYYVKGNGDFDLFFPGYGFAYLNLPDIDSANTSTDIIARYKLDQSFYGAMAYLNYKGYKLKLNFGIHANYFSTDHYMQVRWAQQLPANTSPTHEAYFNTGYKQELSSFLKVQYDLTEKLIVFGDAQIRTAAFQYKAEDKEIFRDTFQVENMNWIFFNPKIGARYNVSKATSFYLSGGRTTREPTRIDYLGDDRANFDVAQSDVKPETVYNIELGNEIKTKKVRFNTNLYMMEFRNEIAATGALNYFGYAIRKNVPESFRRGIEFDWTWQLNKFISLMNTSAISYNKIKTYTQDFAIYDTTFANTFTTESVTFNNVTPVLTPSLTLNQGVSLAPLSWLTLEIIGRYVSKMYLDNTNTEELTVPAYFNADLRLALKLNSIIKNGDHSLSFQLNNFTNSNYFNSGTPNHFVLQNTSGGFDRVAYPSYFPAAPTNFFVTLNLKFQ